MLIKSEGFYRERELQRMVGSQISHIYFEETPRSQVNRLCEKHSL